MRSVELEGTELALRERGSGPLALFVHGYPLDSSMWLDPLERLADVRRCVAPDLRGFGRSLPTTSSALTMERHADDLAALIRALGAEAADVVGLSMGGYVALALVERHPALVRTLALVDTKAAPDSEQARAGRDAAARRLLEHGRAALASGLHEALLAPGASATARARLLSMAEGTRYETFVAALEGMKLRPDRGGVLAGLRIPVAVVVGEHDGLTPIEEARKMAALVPGARLTIVPGAGHLSPLEAPDAVSDALRALWS